LKIEKCLWFTEIDLKAQFFKDYNDRNLLKSSGTHKKDFQFLSNVVTLSKALSSTSKNSKFFKALKIIKSFKSFQISVKALKTKIET
jgi:hypothetical protein